MCIFILEPGTAMNSNVMLTMTLPAPIHITHRGMFLFIILHILVHYSMYFFVNIILHFHVHDPIPHEFTDVEPLYLCKYVFLCTILHDGFMV